MAKEIPLSRGLVAIVDEEDYSRLSQFKWSASPKGHTFCAMRCLTNNGKQTFIFMHREIMKARAGHPVDHANGNGIDNRRSNLRICTYSENSRNRTRMQSTNTSGIHGVFWERSCNRWRVQISLNNRNKHIGVFFRREEAARTRNEAARKYYGEYAPGGVS